MDTRKVILLVGALVVAAITAFFAHSLVFGSAAPQAAAAAAPAPPPPPVVDGPEVLVATRALPVGTILDATALKYQPWPKEMVSNAYFLKEKSDLKTLVGTVVRNAITAGQPITQGALVKPGDRGFLAAALGPGMRAVTVPVSADSAVAGFVFPGDRVDLLLTQSVAGNPAPAGANGAAASNPQPLEVSETIMRNLRVLATDQRTDNTVGEDGKTVVRTFSTVTVEATPKIAEQIAVARKIGDLSLSLRSIADNQGELEAAIASGDVAVPNGTDPNAEKAMMLRFASQPSAGKDTFAVGGDVSRFQRRTVPGSGDAKPKGPEIRVSRGGGQVETVSLGGKN